MIKNFYRGLAVLAFASLLLATLVPAPLFAATGYSIHTGMEQDTDQGDDEQDDQDEQAQDEQAQDEQAQDEQADQNVNTQDDSTQNQVRQDQGQQQVNGQDACANLTILGGAGADQQVQQQTGGLTVGTSRRTAGFPTNCWVSLGPDDTHWYQFRYQGLAATDDDDDDSDSTGTQPDTVNARLQMDTAGCVDFWVMTPRRLQNPDPDDDDVTEPVGAGTPAFIIEEDGDNRDESELTWQGSAAANVTFYILVMNNRDFSCAYNLSLEGAGVPVQGRQNQGQQNQGQQQGQQNQGQQQGQQNQGQQNQNQQQGQQNQQGVSCPLVVLVAMPTRQVSPPVVGSL
ncbi:MAG: hypothetical protein R3E79_31295 [Caldilineaceae bacterium]